MGLLTKKNKKQASDLISPRQTSLDPPLYNAYG